MPDVQVPFPTAPAHKRQVSVGNTHTHAHAADATVGVDFATEHHRLAGSGGADIGGVGWRGKWHNGPRPSSSSSSPPFIPHMVAGRPPERRILPRLSRTLTASPVPFSRLSRCCFAVANCVAAFSSVVYPSGVFFSRSRSINYCCCLTVSVFTPSSSTSLTGKCCCYYYCRLVTMS